MKHCYRCKSTKDRGEFHKNKSTKSGYAAYCKECSSKIQKKIYSKDPEKYLSYNLKHNYGMSLAEYRLLESQQEGLCIICGDAPSGASGSGQRLHVDHNHQTGKIRGLLCSRCNTALGLFREDVSIISEAIAYLLRHNG